MNRFLEFASLIITKRPVNSWALTSHAPTTTVAMTSDTAASFRLFVLSQRYSGAATSKKPLLGRINVTHPRTNPSEMIAPQDDFRQTMMVTRNAIATRHAATGNWVVGSTERWI